MKLKTLLAATVAALALTSTAQADDIQWGGTAALTSDYVFRGFSRSDSDPAVQAGFEGTNGMFYAGVWGSNVTSNNNGASSEFDFYAGFTPEAWGWNWDLGAIYYWFPNNGGAAAGADMDFVEIHAGANRDFGPANFGLHVFYSPEFSGETGDAFYTEASLSGNVNEMLTLSGAVGHQTIDQAQDYTNWNLGATVHIEGFDVDLRYHDNDETSTYGDSRGVIMVSRSF